MRIKIGDKVYNGTQEPVMVIFTESDKRNIERLLANDLTKYAQFPDGMSEEAMDAFMQVDPD